MSIVRLLLWLTLSCLSLYFVNIYSFTLAHSTGGILAVLVCPGILVIVANLLIGMPGWVMAVVINLMYYEWLWRLTIKKRSKKQAKDLSKGR